MFNSSDDSSIGENVSELMRGDVDLKRKWNMDNKTPFELAKDLKRKSNHGRHSSYFSSSS